MALPLLLLGLAPLLASSQSTPLTILPSQTHQTIDGFGISQAFQRAVTIRALPAPEARRALDLLFHPTAGAALSILRNGIGSSPDMRDDHMVSIQPRNPGGPGATPKYVWDGDDNGQLWVASEAVHTYGVRAVYANAWSAPGYMKTNGNDANGGTLCGVPGASCGSGDWRKAYAEYLVQYIRYYAAANITVTHLGFVNEPDLTTSYASMRMNPQQAGNFMGVLRGVVAASGLGTKPMLTCCDTMAWSAAGGYVSAAAPDVGTGHAYTSAPTSPLKGKAWMTEAADNNGAWTAAWYANGGAGEGWTWANNVHAALTQGNVSAYFYWVGAQDRSSNTNSKLIRVVGSGEGKKVEASKRLWAMAGWSRFVRPGAVRVGVEGVGSSGLKVTGFKGTEGEVVVVVVNGGAAERGVTVGVQGGFVVGKAEVWVTDGRRDLERGEVKVEGGKAVGSVPGRGMVTFVLRGV
ncbi:glycoside hydrolase superfamily [Podospora conica]|nr:glycoside hydrolase superfamily [Schizothecium conicum]